MNAKFLVIANVRRNNTFRQTLVIDPRPQINLLFFSGVLFYQVDPDSSKNQHKSFAFIQNFDKITKNSLNPNSLHDSYMVNFFKKSQVSLHNGFLAKPWSLQRAWEGEGDVEALSAKR